MGMLDQLPTRVSIYEVGPRDGLQNEAASVGTTQKLRLIGALTQAGLRRVEVTSFVSPRWIPQLSDADLLTASLPRNGHIVYSALCPNLRGLERAIAGNIDEVALFVSASETHNSRNINKSVATTLKTFEAVVPQALAAKVRVRAYVSTAWGCPFEGTVDPERVQGLTRALLDLGCYQVSLGDTVGVGTPRQTQALLDRLLSTTPADQLAMHMHDTRGQALANVLVGLTMGLTTFDAAIGGLGGCPYAPGASGNLATEDLVYMLHGMGIETGVDAERLLRAGRVAASLVQRDLPGRVHRAGLRAMDE